MHWLQAIDTGVFRFLNHALANPLFDLAMPFLSGNPLFVPALLILISLLLWNGGTRGRLCVLMIVLFVLIANNWAVEHLKNAFARPRPFLQMDDVRLLVGRGGSYSMPSSHAANWFAAVGVVWFYYRRTTWFILLPLAVLVGFSRIYNGVHYPSDVLAGAVTGALIGAGGVCCLDRFWRWAGQRWFPLWWPRFPSLVPGTVPPPASATRETSATASLEQHWLRLGYVVLGLLLLVRLVFLASGRLELENDEAYQWVWSKHLALSYYSKPPMIAWTQWLGTTLWGDNEFGVRFFSPVISAVIGVLMLRFFARESSAKLGFLLVLITTATPLLAAGSILMTIDPLSVLFWTAAMLAGWRAVQPDGATRHWLWTGLWMGLGFLSKYTSLFQLLCWAVFFALWQPARAHLRKPGPYLAVLVNLLCALPVLIWNAQHGWITVTHVGDRADFGSVFHFTTRYLLDFLGGETALLNPIFAVAAVWAAIAFWRREPRDARLVYLFSMGAPLVLAYLLQSLHARTLPNWIAPAVLPLFCLMVLYWNERRSRALSRWLTAGLVTGFVVVLLAHDTGLVKRATGHRLPVRFDPLHRVHGWREVARIAGEARRQLEESSGKPTFVICTHYTYTSEITFYLPEARGRVRGQPLIYFQETPQPENQFFFLPNYRYAQRKGDNAIFLDELDRPARDDGPPPAPKPTPPELLARFASVRSLGVFSAGYKGQPIWWFQMWECRDQR